MFFNKQASFLQNLRKMATDSKMFVWQMHKFGTFEDLMKEEVPVPIITSPEHLLIKVYATSVNPIDIRVMGGYGADLLKKLAEKEGVTSVFPKIPCHDVSGKVVAFGQNVNKFSIGDEIWGTNGVQLPGALANYILVKQSEISLKPKSLSHIEAASMPYVACTTWAAISKFADLDEKNFQGKKILILGGSGGIGTFACQFAKSLGCNVTATCSTPNVEKLKELNCDEVVDYTTVDFIQQLKNFGKYDIVLDTVGDQKTAEETKKMLHSNMSSLYTTLINPLMSNVSKYGFALGLLTSGITYAGDYLKNLTCNQIKNSWAFFSPSDKVLEITSKFVENKTILPMIEKVYTFDDARLAFEKVSKGHNKGKTIIQINN